MNQETLCHLPVSGRPGCGTGNDEIQDDPGPGVEGRIVPQPQTDQTDGGLFNVPDHRKCLIISGWTRAWPRWEYVLFCAGDWDASVPPTAGIWKTSSVEFKTHV